MTMAGSESDEDALPLSGLRVTAFGVLSATVGVDSPGTGLAEWRRRVEHAGAKLAWTGSFLPKNAQHGRSAIVASYV
jgi:hypothetical protein